MWRRRSVVFLALLSVFATAAVAEDEWIRIGKSEIGPWQIYVKKGSVRKDKKEHVHVVVLGDHRVTQTGVDRYDENGNPLDRDTRYKHRSTVSTYVLDCAKREEVFLRIQYYSDDMGAGRLVLDEKEKEPYWSDILFDLEPNLTRFVCNPKNHTK